MRKITKTVNKFDELSDAAKDVARNWWRNLEANDPSWHESVTDGCAEVLAALGFDVDASRHQRTRKEIYWGTNPVEGSFSGSWRAPNAATLAALLANRPGSYLDSKGATQVCKGNAELHELGAAVQALAAKYPNSSGTVSVSHRGNVSCEFNLADDDLGDIPLDDDAIVTVAEVAADAFEDFARECCAYIGSRADDAETDANSDGSVDENIRCNEYEFTEEGEFYAD